MHEHHLMLGLMRKLDEVSAGAKVLRVRVFLGALSHFDDAHFREHFEIASRGTNAERAALEIVESKDVAHPRAQDVILESVDLEGA